MRKRDNKPRNNGSFACMQLKKNVPVGKKGWKLTTCPDCGEKCWETPEIRAAKEIFGAVTVCTECAIRKATR